MFAKNKVSQSMLDAVNSVLTEKLDEASLKITTPTGTKVLGGSGYGSKKAHEVQHKNPFEKGPSKSQLKGIKAPTKKELKSIGEEEVQEELKGNQSKIDANHNGKIDGQDFAILRAKKKVKTEGMEFANKLISSITERDEGKPGLMFKKIASKAAKEYGSQEAGNRVAGAIRKKVLAKEDISEEQLDEMINEVLSKDASAGEWIHDFVHSKNSKFAGKSKAERKKMALGAYYGAQKEEVEQLDEISKSEIEHHYDKWTSSEHAPDHHDAGDDKKIHQSALNYLKHTKEPKEKHEKIAMHIADKFHGSGIWEEVEIEEGDASYKKNPPRTKMSDVVDRKKTVKDLLKPRQYFGTGKVKEEVEIEEAVETASDKSAEKLTTDTLAGRVAGGKLNSFRNFKVNLTTSGEESIPKEIEQGEDTKEKQKITTNPGPVDIKLDDKLTGPTPYTHFATKEKVTTEEVRGELKKIRNKEAQEHDKEVDEFNKKVAQKEEVEVLDEDRWLMRYLLSKGINPKFINRNQKVSHAKSDEFHKWKRDHQTIQGEEVEVPFAKPYKTSKKPAVKDKSGAVHTPMSRARDLARQALKKVKNETLMGKAGATSESKKKW